MPDLIGWPYPADVYQKCTSAAPSPMTTELLDGIGSVLSAVIAEFQSPPGVGGYGGTGRHFDTTAEARTFDGSGASEQYVGDIVPGTPLVVSFCGPAVLPAPPVIPPPSAPVVPAAASVAPAVILRPAYDGLGYNTLAIPGGGYDVLGYSGGCWGVFPPGVQNISVAATWGYAATVPADVYEAVLCEAASRSLVQFFVPLTGVGEDVKLEDFEINTSSGISVWGQSSPIAVFHTVYLNAVRRYRVGNGPKLKQLASSRRMS